MSKADYWIKKLNLKEHIEGGYYNETYRSLEKIPLTALPSRFKSDHSFSTTIYFMLKSGQKSLFHKIKSDEIWHFYDGSPIKLYFLDSSGNLGDVILGRDYERNQFFHAIMLANTWIGGFPILKNSYSLVGCTVAPGFEYEDFEIAKRNELLKFYPQHKSIIELLTNE